MTGQLADATQSVLRHLGNVRGLFVILRSEATSEPEPQ